MNQGLPRAASCPPIPRPGSPSPHRKPLETFRETGVWPGLPHSGTQSQVSTGSTPLLTGGAPQLPSLEGWVGGDGGGRRVSIGVPVLLLRLGVGRERKGGSSKEQFDSRWGRGAGREYHRMGVTAGLFIFLCLLAWGAALPLWVGVRMCQ